MKKTIILAAALAAMSTGCSKPPTAPFQGYGSIVSSGPASVQASVLFTPQYASDPGYGYETSLPATIQVSYGYGAAVTVSARFIPLSATPSGPCTVTLFNGTDLVSSGTATISAGNPVTVNLSATWPTH